jgi:hypothetical protein
MHMIIAHDRQCAHLAVDNFLQIIDLIFHIPPLDHMFGFCTNTQRRARTKDRP